MLRQRELALEEREKDLVIRELTVALQQLNPMPLQPTQPQPPPEPKKRRRVGSRLLTNFLRSSSSHSSHHNSSQNNNKDSAPILQPPTYQTQSSYPSLTSARSIDISTPSDFHHCLSVQQEVHHPQTSSSSMQFLSSSLRPSLCSTPTDDSAFAQDTSSLTSASQLQNTSSNHLIFPTTATGSPNLRLRVMGK